MDKDELIVKGFLFPNYKEAQVAKKELKNIEVIRTKTDFSNKNALIELYNKLIEKNFFRTVIGYEFLSEIRGILTEDYYCSEEQLPSIKVSYMNPSDQVKVMNIERLEEKVDKDKTMIKRLSIAVLALAVVIIGMFFIAATNKNVGYINTENKILDKYSGWQEELENREKAVIEKEAELGIEPETADDNNSEE